MASEISRSASLMLLLLNLFLYTIVVTVSAWAVNHGIETSYAAASGLLSTQQLPGARLFPIYFPMGNLATGFFIIYSLLVSVIGITTSLTGIHDVMQGKVANLYAAAASSLLTWALTLLALGFACKEINVGGGTDSNSLRTIETATIILGVTQLFCTSTIHVSAEDATKQRILIGRL